MCEKLNSCIFFQLICDNWFIKRAIFTMHYIMDDCIQTNPFQITALDI